MPIPDVGAVAIVAQRDTPRPESRPAPGRRMQERRGSRSRAVGRLYLALKAGSRTRRRGAGCRSSALSCDGPRSSPVVSLDAIPGHGSCRRPCPPARPGVRIGLTPRRPGPRAARPPGRRGAGGSDHRPLAGSGGRQAVPARSDPLRRQKPRAGASDELRPVDADELRYVDPARPRLPQHRRSTGHVRRHEELHVHR